MERDSVAERRRRQFNWPDMTAGDLGSRAKLKPGSHLWWYPAEVNTTILGGNQWFWARNKHPRTVTQLVDIFYTSVGRNGNLILNLSPDKRGLVPDNQLDALKPDGGDHQRNIRHRPRQGRQSHRRPSNSDERPCARAGRQSRHLVGSRARQDQRRSDAHAAEGGHVRCRFVAGSGGSSRPANRILRHRNVERHGVDRAEKIAVRRTHDRWASPAHPIESRP